MAEFNSEKVSKTLQQIRSLLEKHHITYRFLGSIVVAALNGKLHRRIGDLDLLVDVNKKELLYEELTNLEYKRAGGMFTFARKYLSLETLEHEALLSIGYFYGSWLSDGSFVMGKRGRILIEPHAVKPTNYNLYGIQFIGLPPESVATGIKASEKNPKRQKELSLLQEKNIQALPNMYIHVTLFGFKADWVYHFAMLFLNILGSIRVKLGLAFDPWR